MTRSSESLAKGMFDILFPNYCMQSVDEKLSSTGLGNLCPIKIMQRRERQRQFGLPSRATKGAFDTLQCLVGRNKAYMTCARTPTWIPHDETLLSKNPVARGMKNRRNKGTRQENRLCDVEKVLQHAQVGGGQRLPVSC